MKKSKEQYEKDALADDYIISLTHMFDIFLRTDITTPNQLNYEELNTNEPSKHI